MASKNEENFEVMEHDLSQNDDLQLDYNLEIFSPKASSVGAATWWDDEWTFRVNINVTTQSGVSYTDYLIEQDLDFTAMLDSMQLSGTFDINSIRIIEWNDTIQTNTEVVSQFDKDPTYDATTNAIGTMNWVMEGNTSVEAGMQKTRIYFLYFDVTENGDKPIPDYSDVSNTTIRTWTEGKDYTIENDKIRISMAEGAPPNGGSYTDHIYEVFDKRTGKDLQASNVHWGWMLYSWSYGGGTSGGVTDLEIISDGPVKSVIRMNYVHSNFNYYRYYTINYLDDTVQISHYVEAKTTISQGTWSFASYWSPGFGTTNTAPNSAYGLGGYNFEADANTAFDGSNEFTSEEVLYPDHLTTWDPATNPIRDAAWFAQWDEDLDEGVGTIWDVELQTDSAHTYLNQYGYHQTATNEGRSLYMQIRPQALTAGQSFTFNIWGHIFNQNSGVLTKSRAKGLQYAPVITVGEPFDAGKRLTLKLFDLDTEVVSGAVVKIENSTQQDVQYRTTDGIGNVTFKGLYNDTWSVSVNYLVGEKNYTIDDFDYVIDTDKWSRKFHETRQCNLTTLDILVTDESIDDPQYWSLYNAKVYLQNATHSENVSMFQSDINGEIRIKLPATAWNFSVQYLGVDRLIQIDRIGLTQFNQSKVISTATSMSLDASISEAKTRISIADLDFDEKDWPHSNLTSNAPYSINLYAGDNVTIDFYVEDLSAIPDVMTDITTENWTLSRNGIIVDSSADIAAMQTSDGHYNLTFNTTDYYAGTYDFMLHLSKASFQDAYYYLSLNILNFTTSLERITPNEDLNMYWGDTPLIQFNYTSVLPEIRNISAAVLHYQVVDEDNSGNLTLNQAGWGIYDLSFTADLPVGHYSVIVSGNETNYASNVIVFNININALPTNFGISIPDEFQVSSRFLKVGNTENITFTINYTDSDGNYLGSDTSVNVYLDEGELLPVYDLENGLYLCTYALDTNQSAFATGSHSITIDARKDYHITQSDSIDAEFLDFWDTGVDIIDPPSIYPWGNNASFVINYNCREEPRQDWTLEGADISQLNITYKIDNVEYGRLLLTDAENNPDWGWYDLENYAGDFGGKGNYLVWFNTDVINVSTRTAFYVIPMIQTGVFKSATARPYIWITPVEMDMTITSPSVPQSSLEDIELYLDESAIISAHVNISNSESVLLGSDISGASVTFRIVSKDNPNDVLQTGVLADVGQGVYQFTLEAFRLGEYNVHITSTLTNHSDAVASFAYICETIPIITENRDSIEASVVFSPQNQEITFSIFASDYVHDSVLSGAILSFTLDGQEYTFTEDLTTPGLYAVTLNQSLLEGLEAGTSYLINVRISKTNYTTAIIPITLQIGLPVDPYLGVTYQNWAILGISVFSMLAIYGSVSYVRYARIPLIIKQISKTRKNIKGKKSLVDERLTLSRNDEIIERLSATWQLLDLDLAGILGKEEEQGGSTYLAPGEEATGGF
jgi:hypothetical protein